MALPLHKDEEKIQFIEKDKNKEESKEKNKIIFILLLKNYINYKL